MIQVLFGIFVALLAFSLEASSNQLSTSSSLSTTTGRDEKAKPVQGSEVLKSTYEIKEGSASAFLAKRFIELEKTVKAFDDTSPEQEVENNSKLRKIVSSSLDLDRLAERALISYWDEVGESKALADRRDEYTKLFKELVEENYLEKAKTYISRKYQIPLTDESKRRKYSIVTGKIKKPDVDLIVEFKLLQSDGAYRVVDVKLDETSLEASYRSSFNRIIRKQGGIEEGFPELLRVMEKRLAELKKGEATRL